jgi:hypothetical protein
MELTFLPAFIATPFAFCSKCFLGIISKSKIANRSEFGYPFLAVKLERIAKVMREKAKDPSRAKPLAKPEEQGHSALYRSVTQYGTFAPHSVDRFLEYAHIRSTSHSGQSGAVLGGFENGGVT